MQKLTIKEKLNYYIAPLIISSLLSGCDSKSGTGIEGETEFYTIDFEQSFEAKQQMLISEIADTVEYIELITPRELPISRIWKVINFEDYLIIHAKWDVYLFHKSGQFLRKIGSRGQGPGEYIVTSDIDFDFNKKEILINDTKKILFYDLEGNFLRSRNMKEVNSIGVSDSILWMCPFIYSTNLKYQAIAFFLNSEGDTIANISNPAYGAVKSDNMGSVGTPLNTKFYRKDDFLYFKGEQHNDTVWKISGANAVPHVFINMGKYKMPLEYEPWVSVDDFFKYCEKYWCVQSLVEDDIFFYLFSENRKYSKDNPFLKCIVYDKKNHKGFVANDKNGMGITDDILGGPPLWPRWSSDDFFINVIEPHELLEKIEAGDYSPSSQLQELLSRIGEDTNQLIILCRKKK